jgi:hypothetical protein
MQPISVCACACACVYAGRQHRAARARHHEAPGAHHSRRNIAAHRERRARRHPDGRLQITLRERPADRCGRCEKRRTPLLGHCHIPKTITLPRQARDKHKVHYHSNKDSFHSQARCAISSASSSASGSRCCRLTAGTSRSATARRSMRSPATSASDPTSPGATEHQRKRL